MYGHIVGQKMVEDRKEFAGGLQHWLEEIVYSVV